MSAITEIQSENISTFIKKTYECEELPRVDGKVASVFKAVKLDGTYHIGCNYMPEGTTVGHRFHYDHGVGTGENKDAEVIWMMPKLGQSPPGV